MAGVNDYSTYDCYISFSSSDVDRVDMELLVEEMRRRLPKSIRILYYYEEKFGTHFEESLAKLRQCQCAIPLFTPDYAKKVDVLRLRESGVYKEYEIIADRLDLLNQDRLDGAHNPFKMFPIFWKGTNHHESVPKQFLNNIYFANLTGFHAHASTARKPRLPPAVEREVAPVLDRICRDIASDYEQILAESSRQGEQIKTDMLDAARVPAYEPVRERDNSPEEMDKFIERAFEPKVEKQIDADNMEKFVRRYFAKTGFYRSLKRYEHYIYSGRKGSGKTTLARVLIHERSQDLVPGESLFPIDIQLNDWKVAQLFEDIILRQIAGDISFIKRGVQIFELVWTTFIALALVRQLIVDRVCGMDVLDRVVRDGRTLSFIKNLDATERYRDLFEIALYSVKFFSDSLVEKAPRRDEDEFRLYLHKNFTLQRYAEFLFDVSFRGLRDALSLVSKQRVLFCLDRFDTDIQNFRKHCLMRIAHGDAEARLYLGREIDWLQGLISVVGQMKSPDALTPDTEIFKLFRNLDFFVVIPRDRLIEVQQKMRDAVAVDDGIDVRWKPIELLSMLRKRLQVVADSEGKYELDKKTYRSARQRFDHIVKKYFKELPDRVPIKIAAKDFETDLFLYVLRHTFWRPRDIIVYYMPIIQRLYFARRRDVMSSLTADVVREIVSKKSREVVRDEFINEFGDTILNIRRIMAAFKAQPQSHTYEEIAKLIGDINFEISGGETVSDLSAKLEMLYEIGFIGLRPDRQYGAVSPRSFTYSFMHRYKLVDFEAAPMVTNATYAVHPVFIESLSLIPGDRPGGGGDPVMLLDWTFIERNDGEETV